MKRYCLLAIVVASVQVACSTPPSIVMRHPVNQKIVTCMDESCAIRYETVGYTRLNDAQKAELGLEQP